MRILLVGQAAFAEEVLRGLEAAGDTIAAVVCPPDAGPKPDPVKAAALARGIPVHQFRSLKAPEARHASASTRRAAWRRSPVRPPARCSRSGPTASPSPRATAPSAAPARATAARRPP